MHMKNTKPKRYLIRKITDFTGALFLVFLIVFIWQLYRSPIPLPFLKPYIIKALNHDSANYIVTVDNVDLELVRSIQPIKIIAKGVEYKRVDESVVIKAPRTSVSFSIRALLRGIISPSSIVIEKPNISIFTNYGVEKGKLSKETLNEKKIGYYFDVFEEFLDRFNSSDMSYPESYINNIVVHEAELEVHEVDLGRKWIFSDANYIFDRHNTYIELGLDAVLDLGETSVPFDFDVNFYPQINNIEVKFSFSDLTPSSVIDNIMSHKDEKGFYDINLPISGKLDISIDFAEILENKDKVSRSLDTAIKKFDFEFEGGNGTIAFSDDKAFNYDVSSFLLKGNVDSGLNNIKINDADFNLDDKKTTLSLNIAGVKTLILEGSLKDINIGLTANISELSLGELPKYWPRYIAEDAWLWVKDGIYDGMAQDAKFEFNFAYDVKKESIVFTNLGGVAYINDATLNYLEGMPLVKHIYGTAYFYNDKINIKIEKGVSDGNIVSGGHVILYDLNKYDNFIDIKLIASSSVSDSLKLIDNPPFNYAKEMGLAPESIEGDAETILELKFEIKKDLQPEEVNIKVKSNIKNVKIKDIIKNKTISSENLDLEITNKGLFVKGDVVLDNIPMGLEWNRGFIPPYDNKYRISFVFNDEIKKQLGISNELLNKPYWHGKANIIGDITDKGDKIVADIRADLKDSVIDYDFFGFVKEKNETGKARFNINIVKGNVVSINDILLAKDDFEVKGNIKLDKKGEVKTVDISSIKGPKTNAKARIDIGNAKQPTKINISGNSYDISELFEDDDSIKDGQSLSLKKEKDKDKLKNVSDTDINIAVNRLWTNKSVPVTNFAGNARLRKGIGINEIKMIGNYSHNKELNFKFEYLPRSNGDYLINVNSNDAGSTLKVLRLYEHMSGGILQISAHKDKDDVITGHAKVRNFSVKNTNFLAKILSLASFSGMLDMLRGDGIVFSHFDAPFTFNNGILNIQESKAFGNVLGITADGYYNYDNGELSFKGMIAPAYSLNKFLGSMPIIGTLLSGKDKTIFAANYRAKGNIEDPEVNINPLSAISPNSLKDLFSDTKSNSN